MAKKKVHAPRKDAAKAAKKKTRKGAGRARPKAAVRASSPAAVKAAAVANFAWVHQMLDGLLDSVPSDKLTFQPAPTDNHALWTIGHLATAYSWFASLIDGKHATLPDTYNALFGYKSVPVGDASIYPHVAEIKRHYTAAYKRLTDAIAALKPTDMNKPTVAESHGFASSRLDAIHKAAWHDGWHSGQISSIRRALSLPPMM